MTERSECKFVHGNVNLMVETKPQKRKKKKLVTGACARYCTGPRGLTAEKKEFVDISRATGGGQ